MSSNIIAVDLGWTNLRAALSKIIKLNKEENVLKQKVYKSDIINSISMLPGNPKGLPDESFILINTQIFGNYGRDNCIH